MKRIVILDTWTNNANLGNKIIAESVYQAIAEIFPDDFIYQVSALESIRAGKDMLEKADLIFLSGTNQLSSDMDKTSEWCAEPTESFWQNKVVFVGVGWWQYQDFDPNEYTRSLLEKTLSKEYHHSVRDSYTALKLEKLGFRVYNTGCPTLWNLTTQHCNSIPRHKSENVVLTFTEYNRHPESDRLLFDILKKNYSKIFFWPQQYIDRYYAEEICGHEIEIIPPRIEAFDEFLKLEDVDYVGNRLHAGIRAMQQGRRSIVISIDNRAAEISKDFGLQIVLRQNVESQLEYIINSDWETCINIDLRAEVGLWKKQFQEFSKAFLEKPDLRPIYVGRWALNEEARVGKNRTFIEQEPLVQDDMKEAAISESKHERTDATSSASLSEVSSLQEAIQRLTHANERKRDRLSKLSSRLEVLHKDLTELRDDHQKLKSEVTYLRNDWKNRLKKKIGQLREALRRLG